MSTSRRTLGTAIGSTLVVFAFAFSLAALIPSIVESWGTQHGQGQAVAYTFQTYKCVGGNSQFRNCQWVGSVTAPDTGDGEVNANNVVYRDTPPEGVQAGDLTEVLWSQRDPNSAYNLAASRVWISSVTSAIISAAGLVLFAGIALVWWRRAFAKPDQQPTPAKRAGHHSLDAEKQDSLDQNSGSDHQPV